MQKMYAGLKITKISFRTFLLFVRYVAVLTSGCFIAVKIIFYKIFIYCSVTNFLALFALKWTPQKQYVHCMVQDNFI